MAVLLRSAAGLSRHVCRVPTFSDEKVSEAMVPYGQVWYDTVQYVRYGTARIIRYGAGRYGRAKCGVVWFGTVRRIAVYGTHNAV